MCGVVGFHSFDLQNRIGGIGYWLGQSFSGLGIITLVVTKLVALGFESYDLNKIEIGCTEDNVKSKAIPLKLGFTLEATLREQEWLYNKYVNQCLYSKLQSEYNP
jgi:ribosomal-protein-serine acetyltransferase